MTKTNRGYTWQAINIARTQDGFSINNTQGATINFKLLRQAQSFIASNWSIALIEANN
jgi:hypothetical protein